LLLGPVLALSAGCAVHRNHLDQALQGDHNPAAHAPRAALTYQVHCPDVLDLQVAGRPQLCGLRQVRPDGRLPLGLPEDPPIDGMTPPQAAQAIAELLGIPPTQVQLRVKDYKSQVLYLFGEVHGLQRAVPYQGPETLVDLLQRVGGLNPGASVGNIQVVRAHVADGKAPEVFQVDLDGILLQRDQQSNIRLEPFDQIYVGESSRARLSSCFPPWLRPLYDALCGLRNSPPAPPAPPQLGTAPSF
jgi:protein involved in polysaccharide export with SLBB domain